MDVTSVSCWDMTAEMVSGTQRHLRRYWKKLGCKPCDYREGQFPRQSQICTRTVQGISGCSREYEGKREGGKPERRQEARLARPQAKDLAFLRTDQGPVAAFGVVK